MRNLITPIVILIVASSIFVGCCCSSENKSAPVAEGEALQAMPADASKGGRKVLSLHDTDAVYVGTEQLVCRGRSALCPDKCGHSGVLAAFEIKNYRTYRKNDKYGDPETKTFSVMLESSIKTSDLPGEIADKIRGLKPGTKVHLVWEHVYVTDAGAQYPVRQIVTLDPIK